MMLAEVEQYLNMIEDLRGQVGDVVAGLPAEALNWRPVQGEGDHATNSLAVLAAHVAGAEQFWTAEVIAGQAPTREREAEFRTQTDDAQALQERLVAVGRQTREILAGLDEATLAEDREVKRGGSSPLVVPVRWAILHVIDHTALHLGHMQLTRQLWEGGRAAGGPRWFERV